MIDSVARRQGRQWDRRYLRLVIWAALLAYAIYLSGAAWADDTVGRVGDWGAQATISDVTGATLVRTGDLGSKLLTSQDERLAFQRPTVGDPRDEISCLALNIYFEARGEPDVGKVAVAHVVMNRVLSERFPDTVCEVVQQGGESQRYRCQFTWWCDGLSDTPRSKEDWQRSSEIALAVYWGQTQDPTGGAKWYHADYVKPAWRKDFVLGPKIGRHLFYTDTPDRRYQLASRQSSERRGGSTGRY